MAELPTIELDANEILADMEQEQAEQPAAEESSAEETKDEASTEVEEPTEDTDTEGTDEETPEDSVTEETAPEKPKGAEARKEQLTQEIRELVAKRNLIRQDVEQANAAVYEVPTAEQLMEQGMEETAARIAAFEQRTEMAEFNAKVADLSANLATQALQVKQDFPVFDEQSPQYDAGLAALASKQYMEAGGYKTDQKTGMVYDAVLPYNIYATIAKAHAAGAATGQVKAQSSADKMLAAADTPTSVAPKAPKEDPFLAGLTKGLSL